MGQPACFSYEKRVKWSADELALACGGRLLVPSAGEVRGAFLDTRQPLPQGLFVAVVGVRDGHDFLQAAVEGGAAACLVQAGRPRPDLAYFAAHRVALIEVDDSVIGLTNAARQVARSCNGPRIAISGSNGKTTTRSYVGAVVRRRYQRVCETIGNLNNHLGVPLSLLNGPDHADAIVLELGMSALGENAHLAEIVQPTICVITSIALEHLETMGSLENIARAEAEPAAFLQPGGWIVLPDNEPLLHQAIDSQLRERELRFGEQQGSAASVQQVELADTTRCEIVVGAQRVTVEVQAIGRHNARNAAAALLVADRLEIDLQDAATGLSEVAPVGDRSRILALGPHTIIADCYNSNPGSVAVALATLAELGAKKHATTIALLGDMLELGPTSPTLHAEVGLRAAELKIAHLLAFGPLSRATIEAAASTCHTRWHDDTNVAAAHLQDLLQTHERCVVLVKGSRGMRLERVIAQLVAAHA